MIVTIKQLAQEIGCGYQKALALTDRAEFAKWRTETKNHKDRRVRGFDLNNENKERLKILATSRRRGNDYEERAGIRAIKKEWRTYFS